MTFIMEITYQIYHHFFQNQDKNRGQYTFWSGTLKDIKLLLRYTSLGNFCTGRLSNQVYDLAWNPIFMRRGLCIAVCNSLLRLVLDRIMSLVLGSRKMGIQNRLEILDFVDMLTCPALAKARLAKLERGGSWPKNKFYQNSGDEDNRSFQRQYQNLWSHFEDRCQIWGDSQTIWWYRWEADVE